MQARRHNGDVDERERKRLLGQWGVRDESALERREREVLERELAGLPFEGRRVRPRALPFSPSSDRYVASLGGPLPYMARLREIEEETAAHEAALEEAWRELSAECADDPGRFARRWDSLARRWNFVAVNELIDRHNRFYPVESRLPMDPRTRDFALVNGESYRRPRLNARWVLERFPPRLDAALAA
jgi:hypothetical protein